MIPPFSKTDKIKVSTITLFLIYNKPPLTLAYFLCTVTGYKKKYYKLSFQSVPYSGIFGVITYKKTAEVLFCPYCIFFFFSLQIL